MERALINERQREPGDMFFELIEDAILELMFNWRYLSIIIIALFMIGCGGGSSGPTSPSIKDPYAKMVVSSDIRCNGINLETNTDDALGPPNFTEDRTQDKSLPGRYAGFVSLGNGGSIILDMGNGTEVFDGTGNDLRIWQAVSDEAVSVYVSTDLVEWYSLGTKKTPGGYADFDLATAGIRIARYVKIVDGENYPTCYETAGPDIDSVQALNLS